MTVCSTFSSRIDFSKWMSNVPSSTKLSKMSIPGTHDSMSYDERSNEFTQRMDITSQLNSGIRFIDVGIKIDQNNPNIFQIHSENQANSISLTGLLDLIKSFLRKFNSETVILNWKEKDAHHQWERNNFQALDLVFKEYSGKPHYLIYLGTHSNTEYSTPTLGEVRGRVVLINYKKSQSETGSKAFDHGFDDNGNTKTDENKDSDGPIGFGNGHTGIYTAKDCTTDLYLEPIMANVRRAGAVTSRDQYYMSWLNYKVTWKLRSLCRRRVNKDFYDKLVNEFPMRNLTSTGIVIMDFPTIDIVGGVVSFNLQGMSNNN